MKFKKRVTIYDGYEPFVPVQKKKIVFLGVQIATI